MGKVLIVSSSSAPACYHSGNCLLPTPIVRTEPSSTYRFFYDQSFRCSTRTYYEIRPFVATSTSGRAKTVPASILWHSSVGRSGGQGRWGHARRRDARGRSMSFMNLHPSNSHYSFFSSIYYSSSYSPSCCKTYPLLTSVLVSWTSNSGRSSMTGTPAKKRRRGWRNGPRRERALRLASG